MAATKWLIALWVIEKKTGVCLFEHRAGARTSPGRKHPVRLESDLFTGFLLANIHMGAEVADDEISAILFRGMKISFKTTKFTVVAVATERRAPKRDVLFFLSLVARGFERQFRGELERFGGKVDAFAQFRPVLAGLIRKKRLGLVILGEFASAGVWVNNGLLAGELGRQR
ncbi:MAG: hypothetical protein ACTSU5_14355 [Promethearchaeota archaeon]